MLVGGEPLSDGGDQGDLLPVGSGLANAVYLDDNRSVATPIALKYIVLADAH